MVTGSRLALFAAVLCLAAASLSAAQAPGAVAGTVRDTTDAALQRADVVLMTAEHAVVARGTTDASGRFSFSKIAPGRYLLVVSFPGFTDRRLAVAVGSGREGHLRVVLQPAGMAEDVTVTAVPGSVQDVLGTAQPVTVIDAPAIELRAKAIVAQAVAEEAGVHMLRTSPTMAGIYVRGLTGNKVNVFVDGVRYSTSAARGGVNTFLDLIDPTSLRSIEVLRGPNSAQYGSDAIGGSVQFLSPFPALASGSGHRLHGAVSATATGADRGVGTNLSGGIGWGRFGIFANLAGRRLGEMRPGRGIDSHAAATRFLGLASNRFTGERLPGSGFNQYGGLLKLTWAPTANEQFTAFYNRSQQDGASRYDQLLGGDGNLVADLRNLMLDFFYVRYQRLNAGWFDQASVSYSFNTQREERVNQGGNGNPRASIAHEYERIKANGFQANATRKMGRHELRVGGEFYPERIKAPSFAYNPVTGVSTTRRGRVPDHAGYRSSGVFAQDQVEVIPDRLQLVGNLRYGRASYESRASDSPVVDGKALWPDDSLQVSAVTFKAGVAAMPGPEGLSLTANVSRGYRAPHITDLGTVGLTGSGFLVSASGLAGMGATVGSTAGAAAVSTGRPVEQVAPETSLSYEGGVHYRASRFSTSFSAFVNDLYDNIAYQALVLPAGAVGLRLGDQVIASQTPNGVVYVQASSSPVLVRTNFGDARIYGVEHKVDWRPLSAWTVGTVFTYLHASDKATGEPPNIEGGTPAPDGYLKVRYLQPGGRFWVETYVHAAARQSRLSTLDIEDRRTGATRTRSNIRNFFYNGATARGWVGPGPDGTAGNADDVLLATEETLAQVQSRVLGTLPSAPLVTAIPGYVTAGIRGAVKLGAKTEVAVDVENVGDRNYRGIAWGMDAPGRNVSVRVRTTF
jgi:outer membrane receptor protein involved in Fe transport